MDSLILADRSGGHRLELTPIPHPYPQERGKMPSWRAHLSGQGLDAEVEFTEEPWQEQYLTTFFAELPPASRGWIGERIWRSGEGQIQLTATHNGTDGVVLGVVLSRGFPAWSATADLEFDPGADMESIANKLKRLSEEALKL